VTDRDVEVVGQRRQEYDRRARLGGREVALAVRGPAGGGEAGGDDPRDGREAGDDHQLTIGSAGASTRTGS